MNMLRELFGLFVDDDSLAVAILITIAAGDAGLPLLGLPPALNAVILFLACAALLFENVVRAARKQQPGSTVPAAPQDRLLGPCDR